MTTPENEHSDDQVLSPQDIAEMNLGGSTQQPVLAPDEPAADPTLDERLITPRGQFGGSIHPQDESAFQQAAKEESAPTAEPDTQPEQAPRYYLVKRQSVKLGKMPTSKPTALKDEDVTMVSVMPLPSTTQKGVDECLADGNPRSVDETWLTVLDRSLKLFHDGDEHQDALSREGSVWNNRLVTEGNMPLTITRSSFPSSTDSDLKSDKAALAIRTHIGLGTIANIPLWNSGIWITVRDPGDAVLQEAIRKQTTERARVGRSTHAMGFSNHMVYTLQTFTELVLSCVTGSSAHPDVDLLKNISILDFETLIWGLACVVYPNGFEYARACTSGPDKCNDIQRAILALNTCLYVDETKLTHEQRLHMSNTKKGWAKEADLQRYRDQFTSNLGWQVPIKSSIGTELGLTLQVPTIADCIEAGSDWINVISNFVNQALGLDADNEQRQAYMRDIAAVSSAGQFTQWVKEIKVGEATIQHRETLRTTFYNDISPDNKLAENLKQEILDFSTRAMVSVVGVINYTCPVCKRPQMVAEGDDQANPKEDLPLVVAIDPVSTFLELMYRKFLEIRQRS